MLSYDEGHGTDCPERAAITSVSPALITLTRIERAQGPGGEKSYRIASVRVSRSATDAPISLRSRVGMDRGLGGRFVDGRGEGIFCWVLGGFAARPVAPFLNKIRSWDSSAKSRLSLNPT